MSKTIQPENSHYRRCSQRISLPIPEEIRQSGRFLKLESWESSIPLILTLDSFFEKDKVSFSVTITSPERSRVVDHPEDIRLVLETMLKISPNIQTLRPCIEDALSHVPETSS